MEGRGSRDEGRGTVDEIIYATATELAAAIRERRVSAVEVVEAHLRRIERHNPAINAVVTLDGDGAVATAREVDAALARGEYGGPLHGVPVTLKDCHATAGMRTTAGYPPLADYVPEQDGTIAARLKAAGAIVLGKTNVSTLLADVQSSNALFGRTNNPWHLERTPGGSSGGAAAVVAAGMVPLEIGSDIGGSIRIPAHCCGIVGLKPTEHRVSNHGHIPDLPTHPRSTRIMNCIGPMAHSIDDLDLALRVIAGPDGYDLDVPPVPLPEVVSSPLGSFRLAWASSFPDLPIQRDTRAAIERLASTLAGEGVAIEEALPAIDFEEQLAVRARLREVVRIFIEQPVGGPPSAEDYLRALDGRDRFVRVWEAFFGHYDALICPVQMTTAFEHRERGVPVPVDGVDQPYELLPDYCRGFNLTGHPVVTIPIGRDTDGLPIGIQIVGARWSEARILGIAKAIAEVVAPVGRPSL